MSLRLFCIVVAFLLLVGFSDAEREKRQSDQALAHYLTKISLSGKAKQVPPAYGIVNPHEIGRKRSSNDFSLRNQDQLSSGLFENPSEGFPQWWPQQSGVMVP